MLEKFWTIKKKILGNSKKKIQITSWIFSNFLILKFYMKLWKIKKKSKNQRNEVRNTKKKILIHKNNFFSYFSSVSKNV